MLTKIAHVPLLVNDYNEAIDFYCCVLGFEVREDRQFLQKRWVRLNTRTGEGSDILLSKAVTKKQKEAVGNQTGGRVLFFVHTDNFDKDFSDLVSKGVVVDEGPFFHEYGKVAVIKDLYGNRIDFIEPA